MENEVDGHSWANMVPDALAKIFGRLSLEEMLTIVPTVCRAWRRVSQDAICWQEVDLDEWSRRERRPETMERMVKMLVNRSRGCLREFSISNLKSDGLFRFVAWSGPLLQVLRVPYSSVTDGCICQVAPKVPYITYLDISGCVSLSKLTLEAFGEHCKSIIRLNRNMYPEISGRVCSNDDEAFSIAQHMPQLKHLEMSYGLLSNTGLKAIIEQCTKLKYLDLRGCWYLEMDQTFIKECQKRFKVFHEPVVKNDIYNTDDDYADASDYYDNSDIFSEGLSEGEFDDMEIGMQEEEDENTLYFWPN